MNSALLLLSVSAFRRKFSEAEIEKADMALVRASDAIGPGTEMPVAEELQVMCCRLFSVAADSGYDVRKLGCFYAVNTAAEARSRIGSADRASMLSIMRKDRQ